MSEWLDDPGLDDPELVAMLAADLDCRAGLPEHTEPPPWLVDLDCPTVAESERVTALAAAPPSVLGVETLAWTDPGTLGHDELIDYLSLIEKHKSWLEAMHHRALALLDARDRSELKWSREEAMCALRASSRSAQRMIATSRSLIEDLPQTLNALANGTIPAGHARAIAAASWTLPPDIRSQLETRLLPDAAARTASELRSAIQRTVLSIDPATATERHHRAYQDRGVALTALPDGMTTLTALLSAADAHSLFNRLTAATALLPAADPRTIDQQRADLLIDAVLSGIPENALPEQHGQRPTINVHVTLPTLLGLDDQPGDLQGYGAITATETRRLAHHAQGTWRRLITDPVTGHTLHYGHTRYRPPKALAAHVIARDSVCAFPTCHQPGHRCDLDHIQPYQQGGTTSPTNLAALCRRHHRCKTQRPFRYHRNPDGSYTWNLGNRHHYTSPVPARFTGPEATEPKDPTDPTDSTDPTWAQRLASERRYRESERRAAEDTNYHAARNAITRDLTTAHAQTDHVQQRQAEEALAAIEDQRREQLQRRHQHDIIENHRQTNPTTPTPPTNYDAPPPF